MMRAHGCRRAAGRCGALGTAAAVSRQQVDRSVLAWAERDWRKRLIIGMTGASGAIYGVRLLQACRELGLEVHLCMSKAAELTLAYELEIKSAEVKGARAQGVCAKRRRRRHRLGLVPHPRHGRGALLDPHHGRDRDRHDLERAHPRRRRGPQGAPPAGADAARDALHAGHLENLLKLARLGAIIAPPVPAFYIRPKSVDDLVDHAIGRVLDLFDLDTDLPHRWREAEN